MTNAPRVFLSYARKDGEAFATALRQRLQEEQPEITLWQDHAELEGGVGWWAQVEAALDQAKFLVIVMTPQAMQSEITRREWRYARQRGVIVYPVKGVRDEHLAYEVLPSWMAKAHFFDIGRWTGEQWEDVKEWETFTNYLKSDRQPLRVPFLAPDLPQGFVQRLEEYDEILGHLLDPARESPVAITTAIQGAGGYGKTTLAIALCHDDRVMEHFDDGILWTSLGQTPRVVDELAEWYDALTGQRPAFINERDAAAKLAEKLEHRACLLVVDDVWERRHLEPFLRAGKANARLITTRRFDLVSDMARIRVDQMTADQSVRLLATAFGGGTIPPVTLEPLARRLGEWPLLLKLAAGMIRGRLARGEAAAAAPVYIERALQKRGVTAFDQSHATQRDEAVRRTVAASLDELSPEDQERFQDLAIFPEETAIPLTTLQRLWGLDELDTEDGARRLDDLALIALDLKRGAVTLHDVMRLYLQHLGVSLAAVHARLVKAYGDWQQLPDPYAWKWLAFHLASADRVDELRTLLLDPAWLNAQLRVVGPYAVLEAFQWCPNDPDAAMIHDALRLSLPTLAADPDQLGEQLWGRLPSGTARLERFRDAVLQIVPIPRFHARWRNLLGPIGALRQSLPQESWPVGALALSNRRVLSWSLDKTLRVWNLETGEGRPLTGHQDVVDGALVLADGRVLSWSRDKTLRVWDLKTWKGWPLTGHDASVDGALALPDGRVLSWSRDKTLRVWDLKTSEGWPLRGHEDAVGGALVLPDGRVLSWSRDNTLRVWNLETGETWRLTGHEGWVSGGLVLSDGRVLSWSRDRTLRVWNLKTGEGWPLTGHASAVKGALLLRDGRVLSWGDEVTLWVWNLKTRKGLPLRGHAGRIKAVIVLLTGRVVSWDGVGRLRVWDLEIGQGRTLIGHERTVWGTLGLPDGRLLSWGDDGTLRVWNLETGEGSQLTGHEGSVEGALVLPEGGVVSWGIDRTLRVWDLGPEKERQPLIGHEQRIEMALRLSDGQVLSWSRDGTKRVWNLGTGQGSPVRGHDDSVSENTLLNIYDGALALPDGRVLSWSGDTLRVWDLVAGEEDLLKGHNDFVQGALALLDGRVLSWAQDGTLRVWNDRRQLLLLIGDNYSCRS